MITTSDKYLIINADDFGYCDDRDQAIIQLLRNRKISSTTCLVNGLSFENNIELIKCYDCVGIHLNLTEGDTISDCKTLKQNNQMYGKMGFREKLSQIDKLEIENEIRSQVQKFIKFYGRIPSHFDGHQHIHVIPEIAQIISQVMSEEFGIYKTRFPIEKLDNSIEFYHQVVEQSKISKQIYENCNIQSTDNFIGLNFMNGLNLEQIQLQNGSTELMVHPGFKSQIGDDFNQHSNRLHEFELLNTQELSQEFNLISFQQLRFNHKPQWKILLISQLKKNTGNQITAIRIRNILQQMNYKVYLRSIDTNQDLLEQQEIISFCKNLEINFIIGINAYRSGILINKCIQQYKIPYIIIIAGTDVNQFLYEFKNEVIKVCEESDFIISLSDNGMSKLLNEINYDLNNTKIIFQSAKLEINDQFSLKKQLNINGKIVILPAGIREVKDINYCLESMFKLLNNEYQDHHFFIIGQILNQEYYDQLEINIQNLKKKYQNIQDRIQILKPISHDKFLNFLQTEVDLVLNSSLNEGMCGSIVEAFFMKVPVLARNIIANQELLRNGEYGHLFNDLQEFENHYRKIFQNCNQVQQAYEFAINNLSIQKEQQQYEEVLQYLIKNQYRQIDYENGQLKILLNKVVHPYQEDNLNLFNQIQINKVEKQVKVLDIACGLGIFGFKLLQKLIQNQIEIELMTFSDYQIESVQQAEININLNLSLFKNQIKKFEFIQSDIIENIKNKYDFCTGNFPQTPYPTQFRIDKCGFEDGCKFNSEFINNINKILNQNGIVFMLLINLSNPKKIEQAIQNNNLKKDLLYIENRKILKQDLNNIKQDLFAYLLKCKENNLCQFINEDQYIEITASLVKIYQS